MHEQLSATLPPNPVLGPADAPLPPLGRNLNVLMIWPRFPSSFWGFEGVLEMLPEAAMTPPLGLITVAALCPPSWKIRLMDQCFEEIRDEDLLAADLVMISAMHAQRFHARDILLRARALGRRTFVGGPWASTDPEGVLECADHVIVGEAEEAFPAIASALEQGTAQRLYRVVEKPDMTASPIPRFDLLRLDKYTSMPVQFSRGPSRVQGLPLSRPLAPAGSATCQSILPVWASSAAYEP